MAAGEPNYRLSLDTVRAILRFKRKLDNFRVTGNAVLHNSEDALSLNVPFQNQPVIADAPAGGVDFVFAQLTAFTSDANGGWYSWREVEIIYSGSSATGVGVPTGGRSGSTAATGAYEINRTQINWQYVAYDVFDQVPTRGVLVFLWPVTANTLGGSSPTTYWSFQAPIPRVPDDIGDSHYKVLQFMATGVVGWDWVRAHA